MSRTVESEWDYYWTSMLKTKLVNPPETPEPLAAMEALFRLVFYSGAVSVMFLVGPCGIDPAEIGEELKRDGDRVLRACLHRGTVQ